MFEVAECHAVVCDAFIDFYFLTNYSRFSILEIRRNRGSDGSILKDTM